MVGWMAPSRASTWKIACSAKTTLPTIFSGVPAAILLRQSGILPFCDNLAFIYLFQKREVAVVVLRASL